MKKNILFLFCLFFFLHEATAQQVDTAIYINEYSTEVRPFADTSYRLVLLKFDSTTEDEAVPNSILTFYYKNSIVFKDSLYCMNPWIDFSDFNNDKVKDIMVFFYTGGRANPTYHLYLKDKVNHRLIRVRGFEDIPNPQLNSRDNIITGIGLGGMDYFYSFYRISKAGKLLDLGNRFTGGPNDDAKYDRAIRRIKAKYK